MNRRDFVKSLGAAGAAGGGLVAGWSTALAGFGASPANAAHHEGGSSKAGDAMANLLTTLEETRSKYLTPEFGVETPDQIAEGERAIAHLLHTGLFFWMEANPERPVFKPYVTPTRKLLGDNPDSVYFFAPIRDDRSYRVTGNVAGATFTSFTIEGGSAEGHAARSSIAALGDDEMEIGDDGSFEITVSRDKPKSGNWLKLAPGAGQITTRHYHESRISVAANPEIRVPLRIEPLDPAPLPAWGGDAHIAKQLRSVANFVREHAAMEMPPQDPKRAKAMGWISLTPNKFNAPGQWAASSGNSAYGNTHAWYNSGDYVLEPDQALVITGTFPQCRFANVVLWNRYMQTFDFANRRVSLNRQQVVYEDDGSFRMVIAHRDPGVPNWLDTEGRRTGRVYWRYVFPTTTPAAPKTELVKVSSLS